MPEDGAIISVALPFNVASIFHYSHSHAIEPGTYVRVPLGNKTVTAITWEDVPCDLELSKLKPITACFDLPIMQPSLRRTLEKTALYNCASLGNCLKLALPCPTIDQKKKTIVQYVTSPTIGKNVTLTPKRQKILTICSDDTLPRTRADLIEAGCSIAVINSLVAAGALMKQDVSYDYSRNHKLRPKPPIFTEKQQVALQRIAQEMTTASPRIVLDGATGSGKTEIYFQQVEAVLQAGRQALILLPEIALSLQIIKRAAARFGIEPTLWHSSMTPAARQQALLHIIHGGASLIIGARSALFLPYKDLALIVVDEAHDASYKQDDGVMYHGRDMAVLRATQEQIPIILATATPSCETVENINNGRYSCITLERRRTQAELPLIHLVAMQQETLPKHHFVSRTVIDAVKTTLDMGKQSLLFLNRRGYAPLMLCRTCGYHHQCPHCSSWLVYHESRNMMQCHHCGFHDGVPTACPECQATKDHLILCGPGVERVYAEVKQHFSDARIEVLSGDTKGLAKLMTAMQRGDIDIAIGTQLLAKGHHFPHLETVGIIDADAGLAGSDMRAAEKSYQLLHQLAGRAGREKTRGNVYMQTYQSEHPMMQALQHWDRDTFITTELENRKQALMPPYGRLAALIIEGKDERLAANIASHLHQHKPQYHDVLVLGPAPAPMYKLRNKYRHRFLVRAPKAVDVQRIMLNWKALVRVPNSITVKIDIDPINFM